MTTTSENGGAAPRGAGPDTGRGASAHTSGHANQPGSVLVPPEGWRVAPDGGRAHPLPCRHLDGEDPSPVRLAVTGCAECLAAGRDDWVHLRVCLRCGHNGCCDSSPGAHAYRHASRTGHPLAVAVEESWAWCYADELFLIPASPATTTKLGGEGS
ncbi:UBP-type zinc finger domain-containing protein [Streptomyces sp. NPDC093089]|uniref:UBP-type zinc finger domain-containing protein n=1 Tax=Streptomyces sp. NPDC093089 TaxID=3366024 RepID=UPI003806C318